MNEYRNFLLDRIADHLKKATNPDVPIPRNRDGVIEMVATADYHVGVADRYLKDLREFLKGDDEDYAAIHELARRYEAAGGTL